MGRCGPFLPAAAMVVAVVTPVVFCAKASKKCKKTLKLFACKQCLNLLLYIVKDVVIHVTLNRAWQ